MDKNTSSQYFLTETEKAFRQMEAYKPRPKTLTNQL